MIRWLEQMIQFLPDGTLYYALITLIAFCESIPLVGLAVPGSTLIVLAGYLVVHGKGALLSVVFASIIGAGGGDLFAYWLGARMGQPLLHSRWARKNRSTRIRAENFLNTHGGKSLFYARFLGPIRGTVPFLAGVTQMRPGFFGGATLISAILWGLAYPGIGYLGGESWQRASSLSSRFGLLIALALAVSLFHVWLKRKSKG